MIPHRKFTGVFEGRTVDLIEPLRFVLPTPANIEDVFGTAGDSRRALSTDRRFVSTDDDRGHVGRAA